MANTLPMADNNTRPMDLEKSNRLLLRENTVFKGKDDTYEIQADNHIGTGGESQVYLAKRVSDGEQVVAKIYDEYADTPLSRRNRKRIIGFLTKNSDYKETHIMPLLDYGEIDMKSDDGDDFLKPIDIIPYCKEGELKKCDYKKLKNKVIPEILHALNLLHTSNLVHRDIKPNNIYMLNGEVVIADFGTSGEISSNDKFDYIGTQKKRGTVGYTAPEVWQGYAVIASDYYSFGCTIATLYKGEHVYQRLIDDSKKDDTPIKRAINAKGLPLECPDTEADLQALVDALVMTNETVRAGYNDILLWINNSQSFISGWKHKRQQEDETPALGFNFREKIYNNETELTNAMLEQWEDAKRYLYRGIVADFFKQKNPTLADKTIDIVEKEATHNEDMGLAMFLHYLNTTDKPICPVYWRGDTYGKLSDISTAIENNEADENSITTMLKDRFLSWKLKNSKESAGEDTISTIKEIEDIAATYPQLGYYVFMYGFAPAKEGRNQTSDEIFKNLTENGDDWYKKAKDIFKNDRTFAYLFNLGYKNTILTVKEKITGKFISDDNISDLMLLYGLFESTCEDKTSVRGHFLCYGPQSYLFWFQQNLHMYSFNSAEAKEIEKRIKNVKIDKTISINDIFNGFLSLGQFLKDFMRLFQNNYLLTYMGLHTGKDTTGITTKYTDAFFAGDFFGINVPVGYLKVIETKGYKYTGGPWSKNAGRNINEYC